MDTTKLKSSYSFKIYSTIILVSLFSIIIYLLAASFNSSFGKVMPVKSFLTWHMIFEFSSILVSFSLFTVTYFIYNESKNLKIIIFGCVFLLMTVLDAFHTLSYKGMPYFFIENSTANRATVLWILSRLLGSIGFISAILIPNEVKSDIKKELFAIVTVLFATGLFLITTYYPNFFPTMYVEGQGLTPIKIGIEYFIMFILIVSLIIIATQYKKVNANTKYAFMVSLVLLIFSEFAFTSYGSIYDAFNYIGHLYKLIAFSILYMTIYIENVITPYREMGKAKEKLKKYSENLNIIVRKRTSQLQEANEILINDIEYAREMQRCLLPAKLPKNNSVSFDAVYLAADHLSGDFYNVVRLDEDNIAIYIGDVSGHGIAAAMLTVFAHQNVVHLKERDELTKEIIEPDFVLKTLYNSFNKTNIKEEKYIVMLYGVYNTKNKSFNYSSAGINVEPYIVKKSGEILKMNVKGFPICKLGDMVDPFYENKAVQLESGDKILFYSDGLVEAKNKGGQAYGQNRLEVFLKNNSTLNTDDLNIALKEDFYKYISHKKDLMDDVTFLSMEVIK